MKFNKQVTHAKWNDTEGKWHVQLRDVVSGEVEIPTARLSTQTL